MTTPDIGILLLIVAVLLAAAFLIVRRRQRTRTPPARAARDGTTGPAAATASRSSTQALGRTITRKLKHTPPAPERSDAQIRQAIARLPRPELASTDVPQSVGPNAKVAATVYGNGYDAWLRVIESLIADVKSRLPMLRGADLDLASAILRGLEDCKSAAIQCNRYAIHPNFKAEIDAYVMNCGKEAARLFSWLPTGGGDVGSTPPAPTFTPPTTKMKM